jgi:glycerate dehydrogenase
MTERIVVLDGYTLNPGDISWHPVSSLGDMEVHERTAKDQILQRAKNATCLLINKVPLNCDTIAGLPDLHYIGVLATGYNVVDIAAAAAHNVVVTNIPTYGTDSVAQHVAALMLEFARGISVHNRAVHAGQWSKSPDWCFSLQPMFELSGKTLGIVGIGRIGQAVARIGTAMGMNIIAHDVFWPGDDALAGMEVTQVEMDELFARSDVISLHCPLTPETENLVDADRLRAMKTNAIIINTSRGPLIDSQALAEALHNGIIGGAGLDVLDVEPPVADHPLLNAPNCIITPHLAWNAIEARMKLMQITANNLETYLNGSPQNVVTSNT